MLEERARLAASLRALGLEPLDSHANFLYVPVDGGSRIGEALLRHGIVVRSYADAIRVSVLDREDDDLLVEALARVLDAPSPVAPAGTRRARRVRATAETSLAVRLALDGASRVRVATGAGLYDHFLEQLAFHAGFDLVLEGSGDLETGDHHIAEDAALALGEALDVALGDRRGIARYGDAVVPMDAALARAAVDLGGRAHAELTLEADPGMAVHMLSSLAQAARASIHVDASGRDAHHVAEAAFKAVGRALRVAVAREGAGLRRRRDCCEGCDLRVRRRQLRSVELAFERLGASVVDDVGDADLAVLPGVGAARAAMAGLRERGHDEALRVRVAAGRPVLGIASASSSRSSGRTRTAGRRSWARARACAASRGGPRAAHGVGRGRRPRRVLLRTLLRCRLALRYCLVGGRRRGAPLRLVRRLSVPPGEERHGRRCLPRRCARGGTIPLPRLIPCLDVAGGRVVKGIRFQGLRDVGDPVELGAAYSDAGADELVFLDVKATLEGRATLVGLVRRVSERLAIPFTVGGGVRSVADADELLAAGADKVAVNSAALERPDLVTELAERLGSQAVVVAIDAEGGRVRSRAGTTETARLASDWAREAEQRGAGEILLTSIDADGTRAGYDLPLTARVAEAVRVPVIASGGAGGAEHVAEALGIAQAALLASILHEDPERLSSLRAELRALGVEVRDAG